MEQKSLKETLTDCVHKHGKHAVIEMLETLDIATVGGPGTTPCPKGYVKNDKGDCVPDVG